MLVGSHPTFGLTSPRRNLASNALWTVFRIARQDGAANGS